jgi:hypothetical protein
MEHQRLLVTFGQKAKVTPTRRGHRKKDLTSTRLVSGGGWFFMK